MIHDHIPLMCRVFDCRRLYLQFTRHERRSMVSKGMLSQEILDAGKARLSMLERQ